MWERPAEAQGAAPRAAIRRTGAGSRPSRCRLSACRLPTRRVLPRSDVPHRMLVLLTPLLEPALVVRGALPEHAGATARTALVVASDPPAVRDPCLAAWADAPPRRTEPMLLLLPTHAPPRPSTTQHDADAGKGDRVGLPSQEVTRPVPRLTRTVYRRPVRRC
jgi:hypothetical protein